MNRAGKRLVLIHGFLENASMWRYILPHLSKKDYQINLPELPGHGQNPFLPKEKTADAYCANLLEQLALNDDESVFIIAHSMGGYLASSLVSMIPTQVRGLCLFHSKAGADNEQKIADRRRAIDAARENKDLYVRTMINSIFYEKNAAYCKEAMDKMIGEAQQLSFETIEAAQSVMIQRPDRISTLRERHFPLYYFLGDHDNSLPLEGMMEEVAQLPGAVAHIAQDTGHMGHIEKTKEAADFIQRILRTDFA